MTKIQQYLKYEVKTSSTALFKLKHKSAPLNVAWNICRSECIMQKNNIEWHFAVYVFTFIDLAHLCIMIYLLSWSIIKNEVPGGARRLRESDYCGCINEDLVVNKSRVEAYLVATFWLVSTHCIPDKSMGVWNVCVYDVIKWKSKLT